MPAFRMRPAAQRICLGARLSGRYGSPQTKSSPNHCSQDHISTQLAEQRLGRCIERTMAAARHICGLTQRKFNKITIRNHENTQVNIVKNRISEAHTAPTVPNDFPVGAFLGSAAEKPIAISASAQRANRSIEANGIICQVGRSPRRAAGFEARKFSGSIEAGSFKYIT